MKEMQVAFPNHKNFSIDKETGEIIPDNNYPKRPGGGNRTSEGKRNPSNSYKRMGAGAKGGTEANEQLRAINPLMNKVTGGWWEKRRSFRKSKFYLPKCL